MKEPNGESEVTTNDLNLTSSISEQNVVAVSLTDASKAENEK